MKTKKRDRELISTINDPLGSILRTMLLGDETRDNLTATFSTLSLHPSFYSSSYKTAKVDTNLPQPRKSLSDDSYTLAPSLATHLHIPHLSHQHRIESLKLLLRPLDYAGHLAWRETLLIRYDCILDEGKVDMGELE